MRLEQKQFIIEMVHFWFMEAISDIRRKIEWKLLPQISNYCDKCALMPVLYYAEAVEMVCRAARCSNT